MPLYDQLHVFIDESGDFINRKNNDMLLLGGVLFWGNYKEEIGGCRIIEQDLKKIVLGAMHDAYDQTAANRFDYRNLHYHEQSLINEHHNYWRKKNDFLEKVQAGLSECPYCGRLEGFVIKHVADVYGDSDVLNESILDNRYERMLELLIESVLLRALYSGENRLKQDGSVHFHIARRTSVQEYRSQREKKGIITRLKDLGFSEGTGARQYSIERNGQGGTITIYSLVTKEKVSSIIDQFVGNLQNVYDVKLKHSVKIEPIHYENDYGDQPRPNTLDYEVLHSQLSDMGYYLADNFLGQYRSDTYQYIVTFDTALNRWTYVDTTQFINRALVNLQKGSSESFWREICDHPEVADNSVVFTDFLNTLSQELVDLILDGYTRTLNRILKDVDNPGLGELVRFRKTYNVFQRVYEVLRQRRPNSFSQALQDSLELINLQIKITLENHLGRPHVAFNHIQSYQDMITNPNRNVIAAFSSGEELDFRTEMALRCAVTYADQFDYQSAIDLLEPFIDLHEKASSLLGNLTNPGASARQCKSISLGRCYAARGQIHAFQKECDKAFEYLNKAVDQIDAKAFPEDIQRDLIYLGHVVCDMARDADAANNSVERAKAKTHWECVSLKLRLPPWNDLATMEMFAQENRYTLALFLKAMALFAQDDEIRQFLDKCDNNELINKLRTGEFEHPNQLILQAIGVLYEKMYFSPVRFDCDKESALAYYLGGYNVARNAPGEIIRVLSMTSLARFYMLSDASLDDWRDWNDILETHLARFKSEYVNAVFGPNRGAIEQGQTFGTTSEYRKKAEKFIQAIRFNYW